MDHEIENNQGHIISINIDLYLNSFYYQLTLWILTAFILGFISYKLKFLDYSGLTAAMTVGTMIFISGGFSWILPLVLFFLLSSILPRLGTLFNLRERTRHPPRTAVQVIANGGIAALAALVYLFYPHESLPLIFLGSLAAATSDTWSTEIGSFSRSRPRLITNFNRVSKGTSGGLSLTGTLGGIVGALALTLSGTLLYPLKSALYFASAESAAVLLGGVIGNLTDSLLGATVQAKYTCVVCGKVTEERNHCSKATTRFAGLASVDNEVVNLLCSLSGGLSAVLIWGLIK